MVGKVNVCSRKDDCSASSHFSNCRSMPSATPLGQLLKQADDLFAHVPKRLNETYNYSLGRFPSGWSFTVTNSWHKWMDRGLAHEFRLFETPEGAVEAFLTYVAANKIKVADLTE
jgi:hypothetical protein